MHQASLDLMEMMRDRYLARRKKLSVLDVGSFDINGSYRNLFTEDRTWVYTGVDTRKGPNVDYVLTSHLS